MSDIRLDWNAIRSLNGSQAGGFEELCAQLARSGSPSGSRFERKGTPDGGVECYAVLSDGTEWGWQAKYFDSLGDTQWSQLDDSVRTAIEKHPRLVRYYVCVPYDRPDARVERRQSAKERWDDHVAKWTTWASDAGMPLDFVYWGSHELLEQLTGSQHVGRVRFWFDIRGFDSGWFSARLDEAILSAGARYTPPIHVDLPIAWTFEMFGRTERFFDRLKTHARRIREKQRTAEYSEYTKWTDADPTIGASAATVSSKVQAVLTALGALRAQPMGPLHLGGIADRVVDAETSVDELVRMLAERERAQVAQTKAGSTGLPLSSNRSLTDRVTCLNNLSYELRKAREAFGEAQIVAGGALMLLRGDAGTGKTHLLCDVARQRIAAGRPTVLLMGQRFVSHDAPWTQALGQVDMAGLTAEEFVGALESAAQAANARALVLVDAINEGAGRIIWPSHLAAFAAYIERSPWLGLVLSVRSSYEEQIVPAEVRTRALTVTHNGFAEHEYDATKTFFVYYRFNLPSTPLLDPEFRNPLFLKTLCLGLSDKGERQLPRGLHGVTAVFNLYLSSVNDRLASALGYDRRTPLVRRALEAFSDALLAGGERSLTLSQAGATVNALLPGRDYDCSLYRGLVAEGVLLEEAPLRAGTQEEIVIVAYERFADHVSARTLLDRHLDAVDPAAAFATGGPLAFLSDKTVYVAPGLLEALCIQVPERTGRELVHLAPQCVERYGIDDAFRQSIVWRAFTAFSDETLQVLKDVAMDNHGAHRTLDTLMTVATLSEHPYNAMFLDKRLRKQAMAERDAWWSIYLHTAHGAHGSADRLIDWASSVTSNNSIDDGTLDLCGIALSWMLTASNRFVRDRATNALVTLMTGRLAAVVRLVERFASVNDPYVVERVYAVAYGTAMRCSDPLAVGALATCVYDRVFASGSPPPHILLRDYARGVIERAIHLGAPIDVVADLVRPPYKSSWPPIPTEDDIKPLLPDWSRGSHDSGELEWARNSIGRSVMDDDFARYVIGTNSSSSNWLSLHLDEPAWKPPERPEDEERALLAELSNEERAGWDVSVTADEALNAATRAFVSEWFRKQSALDPAARVDVSDKAALARELERARPPEVAALEKEHEKALIALEAVLTKEHTGAARRYSLREDQRS